LIKPAPDPSVAAWIRAADEDHLHLSVVTFAEIRRGIERLPHGARRERLRRWLEVELTDRFEGRVLILDRAIAETWGVIMARAEAGGVRPPTMDALLAATAEQRGLTLVTRNVRDLGRAGVAIIDPWDTGAGTA
jgi:predicted nucleic acid-binding protein